MSYQALNQFLLRALDRKSPQTEEELALSAKAVFQGDCAASDVRRRLSALDDGGFITTQFGDGISQTTYALTAKGQHKAKSL